MGKKQHQKDKLYLTTTEWIGIYGGKRSQADIEASKSSAAALSQNVLPFNFCALSFKPFTFPVTTVEGYVFDFLKLMDYFKLMKKQNKAEHINDPNYNASKFKLTNPVTGSIINDMSTDVFPLKFHKNNEDEFHCPITFKTFNDKSHIVAIKPTGNVFSYEAIQTLNLKSKHYKDLLTDETYIPSKDLITIRDPATMVEKLNISNFKHVKAAQANRKHRVPVVLTNTLKITPSGSLEKMDEDKINTINYMSTEMEHIMRELKEKYPDDQPEDGSIQVAAEDESNNQDNYGNEKNEENENSSNPGEKASAKALAAKKPQIITYAHYSKGNVAIGLTCSTIAPETEHKMEILDPDMVRYSKIKSKGYAQIITNLGNLNIELHCDIAPRTTENFLKLARDHFYDNLLFFRSIKHFVIQTGDPNLLNGQEETKEADGKPSKPRNYSYWGGYLPDELTFAATYPHKGRGVVSAANTGKPNTNGSQFFITYRTAASLDKKHTVFGKVVGGLQTLDEMERVQTDPKTNKPLTPVYIQKVIIYKDPFELLDDHEQTEYEKRMEDEKRRLKAEDNIKAKRIKPDSLTMGAKREKVLISSAKQSLITGGVGKYLNIK